MIKIFNSYTQKNEKLAIDKKTIIKMYVCGITAYDFCHIGHGRTFIFFDVVARYLRHLGYKLKYVRNITDVDDKIISKSIKNNESISSLSCRMIFSMNEDFNHLNILPPDSEPRVTEHIDNIIKIISILLENKNAYISDNGDVMFSISSYRYYGLLSKRYTEKYKKKFFILNKIVKSSSSDFVLWKVSQQKNSSIFWNSPWGKGRPGWHIECSAMNLFELQGGVDIHGGGIDLLFPHHENELAQSICIDKDFYVKHWIHVGLVIFNNKKMSKSLGNILLLKDLFQNYDSESIRLFLLSTNYRHPLFFCYESLKKSRILLKKLYASLRGFNLKCNKNFSINSNFTTDFYRAMNSNFNTPNALSVLLKLSKKINKLKLTDFEKANKLAYVLRKLANVLGLLFNNPEEFFKNKSFYQSSNTIETINYLIEKRNIARKIKDWTQADEIRKKLLNLGIILEDNKSCTLWRTIQ